jgi:hypothetical protein
VSGQAWADDAFAALMIVTAGYCLGRLAVSRRRRRPADHVLDATHVLMGAAMAAMLLARLSGSWLGGLQAAFGVAALWFAWLAIRGRQLHQVQHALAATAMIYMLGAGRGAGGLAAAGPMTAMPGPGGLALVLALGLLGYVIWTADQLAALPRVAAPGPAASGSAATGTGAPRDAAPGEAAPRDAAPGGAAAGRPRLARPATLRAVPMSPRLAACCDLAMGVTMGYMLIGMH